MNVTRTLAPLLLIIVQPMLAQQKEMSEASILIRVIDESGMPIAGAKAGGSFDAEKASGLGTEPIANIGITDSLGLVVSKGVTADGHVTYGASKAGYYNSGNLRYNFASANDGRWLPWKQEVTVVLKAIVNPIPMYAKRIDAKLERDGVKIGFDLEFGDFVAPHGKGKQADFVFSVERDISNGRDFQAILHLEFSREGDGLIPITKASANGSVLQLPREAPLAGYTGARAWNYSRRRTQGSADKFETPAPVYGYFFRVRTEMDNDGKVKSALYGKIAGDVRLHVGVNSPTAGIGFVYYLNPQVNERNLEFDLRRNLFEKLGPLEAVTLP